jgi:hypothetical protein
LGFDLRFDLIGFGGEALSVFADLFVGTFDIVAGIVFTGAIFALSALWTLDSIARISLAFATNTEVTLGARDAIA